jgi:hypothetical protein
MNNLSAPGIMMSSQLWNENIRGKIGTTCMLPALILASAFFAGFFLGYVARAWRSHKRRTHYLMYAPYQSRSQTSAFGHARRAF